MLPRTVLDRFETESGNVLSLVSHDRDFYIEIDGLELMSTRRTGSEIALAELGCEGLGTVSNPRVLIGGLGFGFTARAALDCLPKSGRLVVADLFEKVVEWNRTHASGIWQGRLSDRRLQVVVSDVWDQIGKGPWNSILLDTDNGPEFFCVEKNGRLYRERGLERAYEQLTPGGVLAVWSADVQPRFVKRLRSAGFTARSEVVRERGNKGQSYAIYIGQKPLKASGHRDRTQRKRSPLKAGARKPRRSR